MEKKTVVFIILVALSFVAMIYCFFSDFFPNVTGALQNDAAVSNLVEQNKDAIKIAAELGGVVADNAGKFIPDNPKDFESNITSQISTLKYDTDGTLVSISNDLTFVINIDGENTDIRLIGVELPEGGVLDNRAENSSKITDIIKGYLKEGDTVHIEYDVGRTNQYDETFAYVYFQNGLMVQDWLLSNGYAKAVTIQPNDKYSAHFGSLEKQAKENKSGIWAYEGNE